MHVAVQGTTDFSNYDVFMRSMGVALSSFEGNEFNVYSLGPKKVNQFTAEFCNLSENGLKARGIGINFFNVAPSFFVENVSLFDYFIFLSNPDHRGASKLANFAESSGVPMDIFRY
jgi:hypothetical protein